MPNMTPLHCWFRNEAWALVDDCRDCEQDPCPIWCLEFVSCQMDELLDEAVYQTRTQKTLR